MVITSFDAGESLQMDTSGPRELTSQEINECV